MNSQHQDQQSVCIPAPRAYPSAVAFYRRRVSELIPNRTVRIVITNLPSSPIPFRHLLDLAAMLLRSKGRNSVDATLLRTPPRPLLRAA